MAFLGSFGKFLGKGLKGVSKVAGLIPGVGTLAAAGMGGLGELMEKGSKTNLKGFLGSTASGALSGLGGGLLGKLGLGGGGGGGLLSNITGLLGGGGGGSGGGGILSSVGGLLGKLGLGDGKPGFGLGDITSTVGNLIGGGGQGGGGGTLGSIGKLLGLGLGGASTYGAYKTSKKDAKTARQLAQEALSGYRQSNQIAMDRWNSQAPLRQAFNFGAFNMADPTNPFSRGNMFQQFSPQAPGGMGGGPSVIPPGPPGPIFSGLGFTQPMGGGGIGSQPMLRAASVKGPNVAKAQDRGRDQMDERMM